jgi:hypothetical protein
MASVLRARWGFTLSDPLNYCATVRFQWHPNSNNSELFTRALLRAVSQLPTSALGVAIQVVFAVCSQGFACPDCESARNLSEVTINFVHVLRAADTKLPLETMKLLRILLATPAELQTMYVGCCCTLLGWKLDTVCHQ